MKKFSAKSFVTIGMLSSFAFLLMFIKFPIPPFPAWLTVDFSDIPALIAAILFGPLAAIIVEFVKNALDYIVLGSEAGLPIGNMANFLAGVTFVLPTYFIYSKLKSKRGLVISLLVGTVTMSIVMSILNYYAIIPAYIFLLGFFEPMSNSAMRQMVVAAVLPFNLIKGVLVTVLFTLLFTRMHSWLDKKVAIK